MVVEVGVWSEKSATTASVTDSAGNSYVELLHFTASDKTEMSIWAAPIGAGGGTKPTITVKPSAKADTGLVALEYSGVATAQGATVLDRSAFNTGTTKTAGTVSSGATQATTGAEDLAIGFYLDSGFEDKLAGGSGYTTRANVSPEENIELLAQDAVVTAGSTPNPTFSTGASTIWLASTITLQGGESGPVTAPAHRQVGATAGNASANVSWVAPASGNSTITSYTITPYIGSVAQTPTTVTRLATGNERDRQRPDQRHHIHVHGERHQQRGDRTGLERIQCRDARPSPKANSPRWQVGRSWRST